MKTDAGLRATPLRDLIAPELSDGTLVYLEGYEPVHARNVERVMAV